MWGGSCVVEAIQEVGGGGVGVPWRQAVSVRLAGLQD